MGGKKEENSRSTADLMLGLELKDADIIGTSSV